MSKTRLVNALRPLALLLSLSAAALAQDPDGQSPSRGFHPNGSYAVSDIEAISLSGGNMTYSLPLASLPPAPGGRLKPTVYLLYNSKLYDTTVRICDSRCTFAYTETNVVRAAGGGWRYGTRYSLRNTNRSTNYLAGPTPTQATYKFKTSVVFPDGSSHPINPLGYTPVDDYYSVYPGQLASPMTYYSTDGSYFSVTVQPGQASWTISFADGTTVHVNEQTGVQTTTDRNGNYFTVQGVALANGNPATLVTDQLGRKITLEDAPSGPDYVRASGFGGAVERVTTVNWGSTSPQGKRYLWRVYDDGPETYKTLSMSHTVVTGITLPNNLSYQFQYNSDAFDPNNPTKSVGWGEMSQATLPTGAVVKYGYTMNNRHDEYDLYGPVEPKDVLKNYPQSKQLTYAVTFDGTGTQRTDTWGYSLAFGFFDEVVTGQVAGPDGGVTREHFYPDNGSTSYDRDGLSYKTERPDGSTVERRWEENWPPGASGSTVNMYVKTEYVSIKNAAGALVQTAVKDYDYDQNGNLRQVAEYDWVPYVNVARDASGRPTGVPDPSLIRRVTVNTYHSPTSNNANIYIQPTAPRIRNAVESSEVRSGLAASSALARAEFVYDNSATTGNLVQEKRWDSTRGALSRPLAAANWLLTQHGYDSYGNRTSTTDPKNNTTLFAYGDATHANLTGTTSAVPDPSNVRATNTPLTTSTVYDYSTGLVVSTTDANNQVTTFSYADDSGSLDPLDRLKKVTRPDGGWTKYVYHDTAVTASGVAAVETFTALDAARSMYQSQFFDGLGRPTRSFLNVGSCYQTSDTQYDSMGRVWRVSNPYCSTGSQSAINPSGRWTTTQYDLLGRVTAVTAPDGAVAVSAYDANSVTVTDPAGKQRKSTSDALGRLTSVNEAPNAAGYNYLTTYAYDALGNLRKVDQGGQFRYFMYDSLSRLLRAKNPEQAVNTSLALTDTYVAPGDQGPNSQWSLGYDYDLNSNLWHRTDARGVTTTYTYDSINRVIRTDYSDSTPFTLNTWDFAANGRGRFHANYESSTSGTINYVFAYDAVGRPTSGQTSFHLLGTGWLPGYAYSRAYDKAGNITSQTYPSGRAVSYNYDAAGRLADNGASAAFTGNLGDGAARTYAAGVSYDEAGRLQEERFGTQTPLYHKLAYNVRGQLYDVRLSSVPRSADPLNWNRGALLNYYTQQGGWTPGGSGTDNNGNVKLAQHWVPDGAGGYNWMNQYYEYDALNRLSWVKEQQNGTGAYTGEQHYTYDRWGNRQINATHTSGYLIPEPQFELNPPLATQEVAEPSNRLYATGDANRAPSQKLMRYDKAGNLVYDGSIPGGGGRTYDAENRMTEAWGYSTLVSGPFLNRYVYDAAGKRMRRQMDTGEVWQVYGFDGEVLAEYAAAGAPSQPQKEYGYRAGELLVVAESGGQLRWLVPDHLGTPRMTADQTGSLSGIRRHDYLPFGEEVGDGVGGRTAEQGYASADNVRQKFTGYERDRETTLDYAQARYYSYSQGRFTAPDPLQASASTTDPQSFNRYSYTLNNPVRFTDPTGMLTVGRDGSRMPDSGFDLMSFSSPLLQQSPSAELQSARLTTEAQMEAFFNPRPSGAARTPTTIVYTIGGEQVYNGRPIFLPDGPNGSPGTPLFNGSPVYAVASINSVVVLDEEGKPMGPETGVQVTEAIRPASPDAIREAARQNIASSGDTPAMRGRDGKFYDVIRLTFPTAATRDSYYSQPFDVTVNQRIYVRMPGQDAPVLTMLNRHQITNRGINTTPGKSQPWPKK